MWANLVFAHHSWVETLVEIVTGPPNARSGKAEVAEAGRARKLWGLTLMSFHTLFSLCVGTTEDPKVGQPKDKVRNRGQAECGLRNELEEVSRRVLRRKYHVAPGEDPRVPEP